MRFTLVSVAFLALANSLAPGVNGAPMTDRTSSLVVRASILDGVLQSLQGLITSLLGSESSTSPGLLEHILEELEEYLGAASPSKLPRALSAAADPTSLTRSSLTTASSDSRASKASSTPPTRLRRQLPASHLPSVLPSVSNALGSATSKARTSPPTRPTASQPGVTPTKV